MKSPKNQGRQPQDEQPRKLIKLKEINKNQPNQTIKKKQLTINTARSRNVPTILELKTQNLEAISKGRRKSYQLDNASNLEAYNHDRKNQNKNQLHIGQNDQIKRSFKEKIEQQEEYKIQSLIHKAWKNDSYYLLKNERKIRKIHIEVSDEKKFTPLHIAVRSGYSQFVRILLKLGADPNVQNIEGNTPLHLAFMENNIKMAKLLLSYNAQPGILNHQNKSSIYYLNRETLILNFPELLNIPFSKEIIGNCAIEKRVPSILISNQHQYCPLYTTDSPSKVYQSKISYFQKIFKTFKKISDSTGN